jgi:hypothetical protein
MLPFSLRTGDVEGFKLCLLFGRLEFLKSMPLLELTDAIAFYFPFYLRDLCVCIFGIRPYS